VQDYKGNIRVLIRMRPLTTEEKTVTPASYVEFPAENLMILNKKMYEFDRVFPHESSQDQVFGEVQPLVTSVMDGFSVSILAYGQTGTGKTFTMVRCLE
jgi:hypothetical protein